AAAVGPLFDALQRSVELDELGLEVAHQALVQLALDGLGGEFGGVLLGRGELSLGCLGGASAEPSGRGKDAFDTAALGGQELTGECCIHVVTVSRSGGGRADGAVRRCATAPSRSIAPNPPDLVIQTPHCLPPRKVKQWGRTRAPPVGAGSSRLSARR